MNSLDIWILRVLKIFNEHTEKFNVQRLQSKILSVNSLVWRLDTNTTLKILNESSQKLYWLTDILKIEYSLLTYWHTLKNWIPFTEQALKKVKKKNNEMEI